MSTSDLRLSVIVPTYRRTQYIPSCLESLACQCLASEAYEVVVVDDGPSEHVAEICRRYHDRIQIRYVPQEHAGIAAAKNRGVVEARSPHVLFFDDDDVADDRLLLIHLLAHQRHVSALTAILGYTDWHPNLHVDPVMDYVVRRGCFLSCYPLLEHGQTLDYTFFWGGRSSCKRSLLLEHGFFDERFQFGCEDIELGYRLSQFGFVVRYYASARSYMTRPLSFEDFCDRCERQGRSQYWFYKRCPVPAVARYCMTDIADAAWAIVGPALEDRTNHARAITRLAVAHPWNFVQEKLDREYWWCFTAHKIKGIIKARFEDKQAPPPNTSVDSTVVRALQRHLDEAG